MGAEDGFDHEAPAAAVPDVSDATCETSTAAGVEGLPKDAAQLFLRLEGDRWIRDGWRLTPSFFWRKQVISEAEWGLLRAHIFAEQLERLDNIDLDGSAALRGGRANDHLAIAMLSDAIAAGRIPKLSKLNLARNQIEDADALQLLRALQNSRTGREVLETLNFDENRLGDASAILLSDGTLGNLSRLEMSSNAIGDAGALAIARGTWPMLHHLHLRNNLFDDEAIDALADAMATKDAPLYRAHCVCLDSYEFRFDYLRNKETIVRIGGAPVKLDLAGVEDQGRPRARMSNRDCVLLAAMLSVEKVRRLPPRPPRALRRARVCRHDCAIVWLPERWQVLNKLQVFLLHENDIGAAGMAALAPTLASSACFASVRVLHLTGNPLGNLGVKQLANALLADPKAALAALCELHVGRCEVGDAGAAKLAAALQAGALPILKLLSLAQNVLGDEGCAALSDALRAGGAPRLTGLYLGKNQIGDTGAAALARALAVQACTPHLEQLYVFGNRLSAEGRAPLEAQAKRRSGLTLEAD